MSGTKSQTTNWLEYRNELRPREYLEPFLLKSASMGMRVCRFETGSGNVDVHTGRIIDDAEYILNTRLI